LVREDDGIYPDLGKLLLWVEDVNMTNDELLLAVAPRAPAIVAARFEAAGGNALGPDMLVAK
jgi:hypothetical protein